MVCRVGRPQLINRQIWRSRSGPPPPRSSLDDAPDLPLATANIFSVLSFHVKVSKLPQLTTVGVAHHAPGIPATSAGDRLVEDGCDKGM